MHFKSTNTFSHFPTFILKWQFSTTTTTSLMGKDMNINHCFMGKSGCKNGSTIYLGVFIKVYCNPRTDWKTITTFLKFPLFYFVNEETHRETYLWNSNFPRSIFSFLLCFLYSIWKKPFLPAILQLLTFISTDELNTIPHIDI